MTTHSDSKISIVEDATVHTDVPVATETLVTDKVAELQETFNGRIEDINNEFRNVHSDLNSNRLNVRGLKRKVNKQNLVYKKNFTSIESNYNGLCNQFELLVKKHEHTKKFAHNTYNYVNILYKLVNILWVNMLILYIIFIMNKIEVLVEDFNITKFICLFVYIIIIGVTSYIFFKANKHIEGIRDNIHSLLKCMIPKGEQQYVRRAQNKTEDRSR